MPTSGNYHLVGLFYKFGHPGSDWENKLRHRPATGTTCGEKIELLSGRKCLATSSTYNFQVCQDSTAENAKYSVNSFVYKIFNEQVCVYQKENLL